VAYGFLAVAILETDLFAFIGVQPLSISAGAMFTASPNSLWVFCLSSIWVLRSQSWVDNGDPDIGIKTLAQMSRCLGQDDFEGWAHGSCQQMTCDGAAIALAEHGMDVKRGFAIRL